jgi:hypothetical protein
LLKDIETMLAEAKDALTPCHVARELIEQCLIKSEALFLKTQVLGLRMRLGLADWQGKRSRVRSGDMICHLIEDYDYKTRDSRNE